MRVLLIDDERTLGLTLARAMSDRYEIVFETSALRAFHRLERDPGFHAIVCDVNMPGESGVALYERVARRWPGMEQKVVFMTGGSFDESTSRFLEKVPNYCLEKPFDVSTLESALESSKYQT